MKTSCLNSVIKTILTIILVLSLNSCTQDNRTITEHPTIIPKPVSLQVQKGQFTITPQTQIACPEGNSEIRKIGEYLNQLVYENAGFNLNLVEPDNAGKSCITLQTGDFPDLGQEGYILKSSKKGVQINASQTNGLFYGIITLWQLFPLNPDENGLVIPGVEITDQPRYQWRGAHLDVCRHFFTVEFVKKYIDILARHKLNIFHWHLTEDQGWRIEIKKYPLLTEVGAWRDETIIGRHRRQTPPQYDGIKHGGYYTQDEIRDIIQYAADRYITIIPEIEMPGHAQAAIAAYPELGCTGEKVGVRTTWGISPYIFNVEDKTFEFLEDVLSEVIELFPSEYIHIGGDEARKDQWEASKRIQQQIKDLGLENEDELQSYFIHRIEEFINSKGKKLIGWDEILEGGLAPNATVMSWRGTTGGIEAARQGHDVIMSPTSHCYFDYYQSQDREQEPLAIGGFLPIDTVYAYEPTPAELSEEEAKHILGAQANVWTEYIATDEHLEYMLLPRLSALSEIVWSPKEMRDWEDFRTRLESQVKRYEMAGWNYRPLDE
jgi:hexosaminidase